MSGRIEQFTALVEKHPDDERFRFSLAQALLGADRAADAIKHLEFCASKKSDWMMPRILLGKTLVTLGRMDEARLWLDAALKLAVEQHHEDPERELRAMLAEL